MYANLDLLSSVILAGFGNVAAGLLLDRVQHWDSFLQMSELLVLVPTLLGLKGNLQMTMASRLSTQLNLGNMEDRSVAFAMIRGNLSLDQVQATAVAFVAAILAIVTNYIANENAEFSFSHVAVVCSSSIITANTSSIVLGSAMILVIMVCRKYSINPDNIAAPIAASLGDITTLALLAGYSQVIFAWSSPSEFPLLAVTIIVYFLVMAPIWLYLAWKNEYIRSAVGSGWLPIFIAMSLSSCGGFVLDFATSKFPRYAAFQPVINGVGGNLVAIQASRTSTSLHRQGIPGQIPPDFKLYRSPVSAFCDSTDENVHMTRYLISFAIPAQLLYILVIRLIKGGSNFDLTATFTFTYLLFALLQIVVLLYLAHHLIHILWLHAIDPDNVSIPILTGAGDFIGSLFLFIAFILLYEFNDPNAELRFVEAIRANGTNSTVN